MERGGGPLPAPIPMVSSFAHGIKVDSVKLFIEEFLYIFPVNIFPVKLKT